MRYFAARALGILVLFALAWHVARVPAQAQQLPAACDAVHSLIEREITPYDLDLGGGLLSSNVRAQGDFNADSYADSWSFNALLPRNAGGFPVESPLNITFDTLDASLALEIALFSGMERIPAADGTRQYQPITAGQTYTFPLRRDGAYTLILRRANVSESTPGAYAFMPDFPSGPPLEPRPLRDESTRSTSTTAPVLLPSGIISIPLSAAEVRLHPGTTSTIASRSGTGAQVFFNPPESNASLLVNSWADTISLLGGDIAVHGEADGAPRILYFKDYGYLTSATNGDLTRLLDANGVEINLSWDILLGVWVDESCAGIKLKDGRIFITSIAPENRSVTFRGTLDAFNSRVFMADTSGTIAAHTVNLNWAPIAEASEMLYTNSTLTANLAGQRSISLLSTAINLTVAPDTETGTGAVPVDVELSDRATRLLTDWQNISHIGLDSANLDLVFMDNIRSARQSQRQAENLVLFEAIDDVIRIVYQNEGDLAGEEHLLLPSTESFIEIITPAGLPDFDPKALPDNPAYAPRALNNLGGECYPINTLQDQANCPPNGYPNPANGNVWYAVTDHQAFGGMLDLLLTRSYNSLDHDTDGPFGPGWSTAYRLDYDVAFSNATNSRPVTASDVSTFPVGLDLTWAPRGLVTAIMPSGSRHVFRTASSEYISGDMQAITMPGWTLSRSDLRAERWILRQDDGLTYSFDRAGRIKSYGYPASGRQISIQYRGDYINGTADQPATTPVIITDNPNQRRIELYFESGRILRSILRDISFYESPLQVDMSTCSLEMNCVEVSYSYDDNGRLSLVDYGDGTRAVYSYDSAGRLIAHDDPRAPIAERMTYEYDEKGGVLIRLTDDDTLWRQISAPMAADDGRSISRSVTNLNGSSQVYTFDQSATGLKSAGTTFTLLSQSAPIPGASDLAGQTINYTWIEGILQSINEQITGSGDDRRGRLSTAFSYATSGYHPNRVQFGYPEFRATYTTLTGPDGLPLTLPVQIFYPDGTQESYEYNERGLLSRHINPFGGEFIYAWDSQHRIASVTSLGDNTVDAYTYNRIGLVETRWAYRMGDPDTLWQRTDYRYDGLGRPIEVVAQTEAENSLRYELSYQVNRADGTLMVQIRDITDTLNLSIINPHGQLIEQRMVLPDGQYLRYTTYEYDSLSRVRTTTQYLRDPEQDKDIPIQTRYAYSALAELPDGTRINGYAIAVTDPLGRTDTYVYDALDRIRRVIDPFGYVYRFDYAIDGLGLNITERHILNGQLLSTTNYLFEARWQLRAVLRRTGTGTSEQLQNWEINFDQISTRLSQLVFGRWQQSWPAYSGRPNLVNLSRDSLLRDVTGVTPPSPATQSSFDFMGRPTSVTYEVEDLQRIDETVLRLLYCPEPFGGQTLIYALAAPATDAAPDCSSALASRRVRFDAVGRLVQVSDSLGLREYRYTAQSGGWRVDVALGDNLSWVLLYNAAGEITRWIDETGIQRDYSYDTLGRLVRIDTTLPDGTPQPEASFTYAYNEIGQVTEALDQLGRGRGTFYSYDDLGRLTVQQDARTANATIYGYNSAGMLSTIISPLGSTTTLLYEDVDDPTRLTRVIDPTGNALNFTWDDGRNQLLFTDARGNVLRYTFDRYGALWRVEELDSEGALLRQHDLRYNAGGSLSEWRQAQPRDLERRPGLHLGIQSGANGYQIFEATNTIDWTQAFLTNNLGQTIGISRGQPTLVAFEFDSVGRLSGASTGDHNWQLSFEPGRPTLRFSDDFGKTQQIDFDALNRVISLQDADSTVGIDYTRSSIADLNVVMESMRGQQVLTFATGDDAARPTAITAHTPGQRLTYLYNDEGLLTEITQESCVVSLPPAAETDALPTETTDDAQPNPEAFPDDCLNDDDTVIWRITRRVVYDPLGRPVRYVDEEQNIETFAYDDTGNLISYQNANGKTFSYVYDTANRLIHVTSTTGIRVLLNYDDLNRVTGICRTRAENASTFAACNAISGAVIETYAYDALGRMTVQRFGQDSSSPAIVFVYDENTGQLSGWANEGADEANSIGLERDPDLGRLTGLTIGGTTYGADFIDDEVIGAIDASVPSQNRAYTYDDMGRLKTVTINERTLRYDYDENGGYTVTDENTGTQIIFSLDSSGFLSNISVPRANSEAIDSGAEYRLNEDGRLLVSRIPYQIIGSGADARQSRIEIQINRQGQTQNIAYVDQDLFVDFVLASTGQVQRKSINGEDGFFRGEAEGYIVVLGYDNDDRPLTLRVSDRGTGRLLFLLTYTYDGVGRRVTETRQFGDSEQVSIEYRYEGTQLSRRIISTNLGGGEEDNPNASSAAPLLLLSGFLTWAARSPRRRRMLAVSLFGLLALSLIISFIGAQTNTEAIIHAYEYDSAGNLIEIRVEADPTAPEAVGTICASFSYDAANRLIRTERPTQTESHTYQYDLRNRLAMVDQRSLVYHGTSDHLLASFEGNDDPIRYYAAFDADSPFMVAENGEVNWLLTDGRRSLLGEANAVNPAWLFDPLGAYLPLDTLRQGGSCMSTTLPQTLTDIHILPLFRPGMLWDSRANLYFVDGRTYAPDLGIFLQRDPLGPDVYGSVYGFPSRETTPPIRSRHAAFVNGLYRLRTTLDTLQVINELSADKILQSHLPAPHLTQIEALTDQLMAIQTQARADQRQQLDLPAWLATQYNLRTAYVDANGALRLPRSNAPGHGGTEDPFVSSDVEFSPFDHWLPEITPALPQLNTLLQQGREPVVGVRVYLPFEWIAQRPAITDVMWDPRPQLSLEQTPHAVMDWLPQTLTQPERAATALDAVLRLSTLPTRTSESWIDAAIQNTLPDSPALPPTTREEWLAKWFSQDVLGVAKSLEQRWPQFPQVPQPTFNLGPNINWWEVPG